MEFFVVVARDGDLEEGRDGMRWMVVGTPDVSGADVLSANIRAAT